MKEFGGTQRSEILLQSLIEHSDEVIVITDQAGIVTYASTSLSRVLGFDNEAVVGRPFNSMMHADDVGGVMECLNNVELMKSRHVHFEFRGIARDGSWRYCAATAVNFIHEPAVAGIVINFRDNTHQKNVDIAVQKKERRYRSLYDNALVGMITTDLETGIVLASNDLVFRIFGHMSKYDFIGVSIYEYYMEPKIRDCIIADLEHGGSLSNREVLFRKKDGTVFWGEISAKIVPDRGIVETVVIDVTKAKEAEQHVYELTFYDNLTGLPNRDMFNNRIQTELLKTQRLAVFSIGIDRFKYINEMYGPKGGDEILLQVAARLKKTYFDKDMVSRFAGDQFMVLITEIGHRDDEMNIDNLKKIVEKTRNLFLDPFFFSGNEIEISSSIGVSVYPNDARDAGLLMKNCESAMFMSKEKGGNTSCFFDAGLNQRMVDRFKLEIELKSAIVKSDFLAFYQPKVDRAGSIVGMESLIRWRSSTSGLLVPPGEFIPLAEKNGMIVNIGNLILKRSCNDTRMLQQLGCSPRSVAVNLSPSQFQQPDIVGVVKRIIEESELDPRCLELEITESGIMMNEKESINKLNELSEMGVSISIDDFGTGYSSLSKLKLYPINTLKIDKSFVDDLPGDSLSATIAVSIIDLAHNLGFEVVAEGVETVEQLEFLKSKGCDQFQGYLFSKPLPLEELRKLLLTSKIV